MDTAVIQWLMEGDVSIQYQVCRDLLYDHRPEMIPRISVEGWGARFLSFQKPDGHWGRGFYSPKWISSHYTLLDLKNLCISPQHASIQQTITRIINEDKGPDGGINPAKSLYKSDVCVNGMFLNYASYFKTSELHLKSVVDFILSQQMADGGFNCHSNRKGATHSSLHTTLSVLEGILEFKRNGYVYRLGDLTLAAASSREFILVHKLYQSHRTGRTIDPKMLMLSYPSRWRYDILKALDYFQAAGVGYDPRMSDALEIVMHKRRTDMKWPLQARHGGLSHFEMENVGQASRWNTLRALRVLNSFNFE